MRKIAEFIVKYRIVFCLIFIGLMVFSVFSRNWTVIEEEIIELLPDEAESKICLDIMESEFTTYGTADIYMEKTNLDSVRKICPTLEKIEHVSSVAFNEKTDFRDNEACIHVTLDIESGDERAKEVVSNIESALKTYDNTYVYRNIGESVSDSINEQMRIVILLVAVIVVIVLLLTTETFGEVLVLLLTFVAAAVINMGTNFIFDKISMISNSIAIVMQLALSVDYAIIFCNRYKEEREKSDQEEAVITALTASIPAISASSLTTIAGLFAITLMQFRLGADLGFVLIKSIIWSLLSVFLFMPCLLMYLGKLIEKTKHKRLIPKLPFFGKFAYKTRLIMPIVFVVVLVGGFMLHSQCKYAFNSKLSPSINQSESDYAQGKLSEKFGINTFAVVLPAGDYSSELHLMDDLKLCPEVNDVTALAGIEAIDGYRLGDRIDYHQFAEIAKLDEQISQALFVYYSTDNGDYNDTPDFESYKIPLVDLFVFVHDKCLDGNAGIEIDQEHKDQINTLYDKLAEGKKQLQGDNYSRIIVKSNLPIQGDDTFKFMDKVHTLAGKYYSGNVKIAGDSMVAYDFCNSFTKDNITVSLLSILFVIIILFFTFKAVAMPLLLISVIQGSIWINFGIATLQGNYIFFMCYLIVSAIQMGANIDYAIVISTRYLEFRKIMDRRSAIIEGMNLAFPTVITSGSMMIIAGMLIGVMISEPSISGIGYYLSIGTMISLCLVLFVLPQILVLGDSIIEKTTVKISAISTFKKHAVLYRRILAALLTITTVISFVMIPVSYKKAVASDDSLRSQYQEQLKVLSDLDQINQNYLSKNGEYEKAKFNYAEEYLTEKIGREELEKGKEDYDTGKNELDAGKSKYHAGNREYQDALATYEKGKVEYETGLAEYNKRKAEYEAGLNQYQEGLEQYNASKAKLTEAQEMYDKCVEYRQKLQILVDEGYMTDDELNDLFGIFLEQYGYHSLAEVREALDAGKNELAEAEKKLSNAKEILDAAKIELDKGEEKLVAAKAELEAGEKALSAANIELQAAKKAIDEGQVELDSAESQIKEGEKLLKNNNNLLKENLSVLDQCNSDEERLELGAEMLMKIPEIRDAVNNEATYADICTAARTYYQSKLSQLDTNRLYSIIVYVLLGVMAVLSLCMALCLFVNRWKKFVQIISAIVLLGSLLYIVFSLAYFSGYIPILVLFIVFGLLSLMVTMSNRLVQ